MKRVLFIAAGTHYEEDPAFRIRVLALREAMGRRGYAWEVGVRPRLPWGRWQLARSAGSYHAVVLQRKMLDGYEAWSLRRHARRILMDIDDATMYHETALGAVARWRLRRRFTATAGVLDGVCAGNAYLGEIFTRENPKVRVQVVPSVVDPARYPVRVHEEKDGLRLVWIGSRSTLKYLEMAMPAIAEAGKRVRGLTLRVIADRMPQEVAGVKAEFVPWTMEGECGALAEGDIGIAPTPEDRWTQGKCGFKIVQYMAAGLPVVASPVGANVGLVEWEGGKAGLMPGRWEEWPEAVARLAGDVGMRREMGAAGRRRVEEALSVERAAELWAEMLG